MAYRVLIVDDSTFFRRRIKQILEQDADIEVVGEAKNGVEALSCVATLKPDVVTMDIEMPVMDGITAVKRIMAQNPVPILMFSSLTHEGAQATLDALDAGALDFLPKKFEDIALNRNDAILLLQNRVKTLCRNKKVSVSGNRHATTFTSSTSAFRSKFASRGKSANIEQPTGQIYSSRESNNYKCLAIGASTGGPVALQKILTELPANFPVPIIIVQHMPGSFTQAFAKRLDELCEISVKEAESGDVLKNGMCYIAPGGRQMTVSGTGRQSKVSIMDTESHSSDPYKPSVNITFNSLCAVYGNSVLAVILTGMGADGKEGCEALKNKGSTIWAQDKESCVVYGMPMAVTVAKIAERNFNITDMASNIKNEIN